ncbi:MAG TPA: amidase [Methylomirabilota bacterium]|jgi:aspartyl-tRNA(Asn)/glutamyl-tRNA(Gln) amidotransferase subunit A
MRPVHGIAASENLVWRSALECATLIRDKQLSPVELTEAILARIEALNPRLNAFCLVTHDVARRAAREAEIAVMKNEPLGPLHGVPISFKDVIYTRGIRTTGGSRLYADLVPEEDAVAVLRVKAAGAVLLGKTNTSEFGHKAVTENPLFGVTRNPWDPTRTPGGSSGGAAAAVAAGLGPVALGTDGGGSVRIPAAFCNLLGFKPSYGRVPQHPGFPGWEHVGHIGPLARTVRDAALVLDVIAGTDDRDRESLPGESGAYLQACDAGIEGLNVAWTPDLGYARVDPAVLELCGDAAAEFDTLGCHVEVVNPGWDSPEDAFATLIAAQFYAAWSDELPAAEAKLDPTLVKLVRKGGTVSARDYVKALGRVRAYWQEVRTFLERFDLLLTPTTAVAPFEAGGWAPRDIDGERVSPLGWMPFTYPFNLTGQPAASVPAGFTADGLPVGLQVVGRRHADRQVLAACAAFEAARPWSVRRPPA